MKEIKPGYKETPIGILPKDWEVKKLGENAIIKGRIGWKNLKQEEYTSEGPYLIAGKHIKNGIINWNLCDHITKERYDESLEIALENGDVIFSKDGTLGNPALIRDLKQKATINGTMMLVRVNKKVISSEYFYQILRSILFEKLIKMIKSGSSIPHIFQRDMNDFIVPIPPKEEQEKIAQILMTWDDAIEKQEELIEQEKEFKKGMMQKIFSQKLRFKDENGNDYPEWEEKKLGEIGKLQGGYAFKSELFKTTGIPIMRISNISNKNNYIDKSNLVYYDSIENFNQFTLKKGDLIIAMSGATTGKLSIYNLDEISYLNQRVGLFKIDSKIMNYKYAIQYCFSKKFSSQIKNVLVAGAQPNISSKDIENFIFLVPSLPEQEKIADFLSIIDEKIEILEKKLEELKEQKKRINAKTSYWRGKGLNQSKGGLIWN